MPLENIVNNSSKAYGYNYASLLLRARSPVFTWPSTHIARTVRQSAGVTVASRGYVLRGVKSVLAECAASWRM